MTFRSTCLWLDCDTGHDDAFTILLAGRHPALRLLGVSTIYGNAPLTHTTHNTRAVLKAIDREDVPVYAGVSKPFCRNPAPAVDIHGASGLDGTHHLPDPTVPAQTDVLAVEAMYRALMTEPTGTAWLVATGALTNVALLILLHPDIVAHLGGLSIMGGAIGGGFTDAPMGVVAGAGERFGNTTPYAEFNIWLDPEAANAVFANEVLAAKTTLITLDLTHQFLATAEVQEAMRYGYEGAAAEHASRAEVSDVRKLFSEILVFFAKTYDEVFGISAGPPMHDPLAVAAVFAPYLFRDNDGERYTVSVIIDDKTGTLDHKDLQCGRTVARKCESGAPGIRIPRALDVDKTWRMLEDCLSRAEKS